MSGKACTPSYRFDCITLEDEDAGAFEAWQLRASEEAGGITWLTADG